MADGAEDSRDAIDVAGVSEPSVLQQVSVSAGPPSHSRSLLAAQLDERLALMADAGNPVWPGYTAAEEAALLGGGSNAWHLDQMALVEETPSDACLSMGQRVVCGDAGGRPVVATQVIEVSDERLPTPAVAAWQRGEVWQGHVGGGAWQQARYDRWNLGPEVARLSKENVRVKARRDPTVARRVPVHGASSTTIQVEAARDFERKLAHKYESVRPGVSDQWSFEMRQVVEEASSTKGVTVHWNSSKAAEDEARPRQIDTAGITAVGLENRAKEEDEVVQRSDVNGALGAKPAKSEEVAAKEAVPVRAARARINILAPSTPAATRNPDATASSKALPDDESGASFVVLRPKESLGDMPIHVSASVDRSREGHERFAVGVTQDRERGSIHLEGQIITPKTSQAELVHGFQMAAVGNVHHVHDVPQPPDWDANYPPHKPTSSREVVVTRAATDTQTGATSVGAETKVPAPEDQTADAEPAGGRKQPLQEETAYKSVERAPTRETFRAAVVPVVSVPSLGTVTKVAAAVGSDGERPIGSGLADFDPSGFKNGHIGGPFLPLEEPEESETISHTLSVHSIDRVYEARYAHPASPYTAAEAEVEPYVASSERLRRISTPIARPRLREEFVFSATTFGLTEKERQALPPTRGPGMSGSRVHLRPANKMSEFGFSATTVGLTDKDRLAIASNRSQNERPQDIIRSRSDTYDSPSKKSIPAVIGAEESRRNARTEFGFSATTIGLTDKDRLAIASIQSLNRRPHDISRSKSNKSDFSSSSKKSLRTISAHKSDRNARTEFGFSATTIDLSEKDIRSLPGPSKSVQVFDAPVFREPPSRDTQRGFSRTAVALVEGKNEEFLSSEDVGLVSPGAGVVTGMFSHQSLRDRALLANEGEVSSVSSLEVSAESADLERSWPERFDLSVSRENIQNPRAYGGYGASEACRRPSGSSTPVSTVRQVLSVIREESFPDIAAERFGDARGTSQTFKVTSARELFGPVVPFEDASLLNSFHNSNPATYNSSNPGQQIDELSAKRLSDEDNSFEASFGPPQHRAGAVRFVEDAAAECIPSSGVQGHRVQSAARFPSVRSMMEFETAYETPHNSIDPQSQSPAFEESRMVTLSASSSVSSEPDGLHVNQELQYREEPAAATGFVSRPDLSGPAPSGMSGNINNPFGSLQDPQTAEWGPTAFFGSQVSPQLVDAQVVMNNEKNKLLFQNQEPTFTSRASVAALRTESASKLTKVPYNERFGYQIQGDAQDWLPYSRYREPPVHPQETYDPRGAFAVPFALPTPRSPFRDVRIQNVEAFVATGGPTPPRKVPMRRNSPEIMRGQPPPSRIRPSTAGRTRKGRLLRSAPWRQGDFYAGPRSTISAQQDIRLSQAYGPRATTRPRRGLSPPRTPTPALQQPQFPMNVPGQYWNNTCPPGMTTSWHAGCYENPAFEQLPPVFVNPVPTYPSLASEAKGAWTPEGEYRQRRRKRLIRVQSLSTFESHENANAESRPVVVRSSAAARRPLSLAKQRKVTSAKTVQTEESGECARCSSPPATKPQFPKIIIPRVKTHVDIDDSNSESRHVNIARATTQTEQTCPPGGLPREPSFGEQSPLLPYSGSQPFSGYVNQNFVCPPYMTNLNAGLAAPTPPSAMPTPMAVGPVQMQVPMAQMQAPMAQIGYYGQTQVQSPAPAPAAPKAAKSSSERAAACPLSSCFKGIFSHEEETSEERPKKISPHCCHHEKTRRRTRSPLPPPGIGNTFTVGYMMNSENELNPVLMPLNATIAPPPAESRGTQPAPSGTQGRPAAGSDSEQDAVARLEKRVQEQMVEIEKTIKEQDARWKENRKKEEQKRKGKNNLEGDSCGSPKRRDKSRQNRNQLMANVAKVEDDFSSSDSDCGSPSWFSWSRTSKSRKGVQLKVPRQQRKPSLRSVDSQTEEYASCSTSREKLSGKSEKIAIPGVSSSETATSGASFTWATRKKKSSRASAQSSPRGSPDRTKRSNNSKRKHSNGDPEPRAAQEVSSNESATSGAGLSGATCRKKQSAQPSPHGSPERKEANKNKHKQNRDEPSPRSAPNSHGSSQRGSPKRRSPPNQKGSPTRSGKCSPERDGGRRREQSTPNSAPSPEVAHSSESVVGSDNELVAKIRVVGFPGAKRTQRRWSRTEMHRSTSYDTATSSAAASSVADRRARSAQDLSGGESPRPTKKKSLESASDAAPSSCWQSVCNIFGGSPSPSKTDAKKQRRRKSCCSSVCDLCRYETEGVSVRPKSSPKRRPSRCVSPPLLPPPPVVPSPPVYYPRQPLPPPMMPPSPVAPPSPMYCPPPPPPPPRFKRRQRSSEDVTERSEVKEKTEKPAEAGGILSNIFNWFSRSGDKQDAGQGGSRGEKDRRDSGGRRGSSFERWMAEKERALKRDQSRLAQKAQKRQRSREKVSSSWQQQYAAGQPPAAQELYFEEEGGPRWVIRYSHSPSHSGSISRSPATLAPQVMEPPVQFPQPCGPLGAPYSPDWVLHQSSGGRGSRDRTPPLMAPLALPSQPPFQPPVPPAGVYEAENDWSVQYLYGPKDSRQGSPAHIGSQLPAKKPTPPVAPTDFHQIYGQQGMVGGATQAVAPGPCGPPASGFRDTPDWSIRITQGREHSSSSRASIRSKKGQLEKHSPSICSKDVADQQPSFTLRLLEQPRRRSRRSSSLSLERSSSPEKKRSEVSFQEKPDKKEATEKVPPSPPAKPPPDPMKKPAPAPPPAPAIAPRAFRTEESLRHDFYEEMDERGRAATMFPAGASSSAARDGPESAAVKMAETFFRGDERRKIPPLSESEAPSGAPPGEKKSSLPETPTLKPALKTSETKSPEALAATQRDKASTSTPLGLVSPPPGGKEKLETETKKGSFDKGGQSSASAGVKTAAPGVKDGKKEDKGKDKKSKKNANDKAAPKQKGRGPMSPGEPAHTNYVLEQRRIQDRKLQWSDPLSYKCPTVQEVVGYAIITAVLLLGLVLLVSVPKMRSHAMNARE